MHTPWHTTAVSAAFGNLSLEIAVVIAILGRGFLKFKSCVKRTAWTCRVGAALVSSSLRQSRAFLGPAHHALGDLIGVYSTIQSSLLLLFLLYEQPR